MTDECIFCKIANKQLPVELLYEDDSFVAFRDINPAAPVHLLIIPKRHVESLRELTDDAADTMGRIFIIARDLAAQHGMAEDGYRLVLNTGPAAGQTVWHIHLHLLGGREMTWPPG